ncbi:type IX secretion system plug protein [Pedobacter sp. MW01-1-1]|uniref:type IX secretion system plug protein n=1 Tax=Pedobacter sp. MW01-1-1 TaxID=3383027 RepID=UPI003FF02FBF
MQKILALFLFFISSYAIAQSNTTFQYENKVYQPYIKTVQCYNSLSEQSIPIIQLNSAESLTFAFDDLESGTKNYWYSIEHCTSDWQPSRISTLDYLESFNDDRLINYRYSVNTLRKYTHYEISLPNTQIRPKISGNYLLKVYLDGDLKKPVISQRFYILDNQIAVAATIGNSMQVESRNYKQKINFTLNYAMQISNPYQDIKTVIMQNFDPNTAVTTSKPAFIRQNQLVYNDLSTNDFWAGNEFRKFDTRNLRYKADHVQGIFKDNQSVTVQLFADQSRNSNTFVNNFDENGNYYIQNTDQRDSKTESEYMNVLFTLNATPPSSNGDAYVVGRFNNYALSDENKLIYDSSKKQFYQNILLKQGLYDFEYAWLDKNTKQIETRSFEGSFFQTLNTYQIFVYYRKPGSRWDTLVGFNAIGDTESKK